MRELPRTLAQTDPALAAQWHPTLNGSLTPSDVIPSSRRKVWWKGPCGHEWETSPENRRRGSGCPYCSGAKVLAGFNDLATRDPVLAAQWHPEKNGSLKPSDVAPGSNRKVWWKGPCGHEWEALVLGRSRGNGCPYCSGLRPTPGVNDLATTHPDVAAMWHPERNGALSPADVSRGSARLAWWRCPACGREWEEKVSSVAAAVAKGGGCPRCSGDDRKAPRHAAGRDPERGWWKALLVRGRGPCAEKTLAVCRARTPEEVRDQLSPMSALGWEFVGARGSETFEEMVEDLPRAKEGGSR